MVKIYIKNILKNKHIIKEYFVNRTLKASHTLEAALVVPVVLFTIISIMYFIFYMHDRTLLEMCAYNSAIESVYGEESGHSVAKKNIANLNMLTVLPTSTWTESTKKVQVKYMGRYVAPFSALEMFINSKKVTEDAYSYPKMKYSDMYIIKVAKDIMSDK